MARGRSGRAGTTPHGEFTPVQMVERVWQGVQGRLAADLREDVLASNGYPAMLTPAALVDMPLDLESEHVDRLLGVARRLNDLPGQEAWVTAALTRHAALAQAIATEADKMLPAQDAAGGPEHDELRVQWLDRAQRAAGELGESGSADLLQDYAAWAGDLTPDGISNGFTRPLSFYLAFRGVSLRQELSDGMRPAFGRWIRAGDADALREGARAIRARLGQGEGKPSLTSPRLGDEDLLRLGRALLELGIHAGRDATERDGTPGELRGIWRYAAEADLITEADLARELGHVTGGEEGDFLAGPLPLPTYRRREALPLSAFLHVARRALEHPEIIADIEHEGEASHLMLPLRADDAPALRARWGGSPGARPGNSRTTRSERRLGRDHARPCAHGDH